MSEWQSIETAPKDGTDILAWVAPMWCIARWGHVGAHVLVEGEWRPEMGWRVGHSAFGVTPTHWMALPAAPTQS